MSAGRVTTRDALTRARTVISLLATTITGTAQSVLADPDGVQGTGHRGEGDERFR